jgi:DNA-directed RNA polymerase specialized sigma24 family protein
MAPSQDLGAKLDTLIRLMALQLIGERTGGEAITVLARAGLDNDMIAELVGTSVATVRATLSRARRQGGKG